MRLAPALRWLLAVTLLVLGTIVWPTRYRAVPIAPTPGVLAAREDRFTGRLDLLTRFGWAPASRRQVALERLRALGDPVSVPR